MDVSWWLTNNVVDAKVPNIDKYNYNIMVENEIALHNVDFDDIDSQGFGDDVYSLLKCGDIERHTRKNGSDYLELILNNTYGLLSIQVIKPYSFLTVTNIF